MLMKKILLSLLAVAGLSFGAAQAQTDVAPLTGSYVGDLYVSLGEEYYDDDTRMEDPTTVQLIASETDGQVDFALYNFVFMSIPLGDILLPGIDVLPGSDAHDYVFGENATRHFSFADGAIEADVHLDEVQSYVDGNHLVAYIPVIWTNGASGNDPIYVKFEGDKQVSDVTDGLSTVTTTTAPAAGIYTLSGRRVATRAVSALEPGLYIVNGKKTLVR